MKRSVAAIAASLSLAAPAAASAATLGTEPDGRLVYRALPGEVNDVTAREQFENPYPWYRSLVFTESAAAVTVGDGCVALTPIACELRDTDLYLGDRDDRGNLRVDALRTARVWGDRGDDVLRASGGEAFASGGPGDDTVAVGADGSAIGHGGAGDDILDANSVGFAVLHGEDGADSLTAAGPRVSAFGGTGPDTIVGHLGFGAGSIAGGSGADQITVAGVPFVGWRIDGGGGSDTIDVTSEASDTVTCGPGRDTVQASPNDVIAADCETVVTVGAA